MGVRGPGWSPAALMYGAYGQIATRADGKIQCHECGRWWVNLGGHITRSHEMTVREYKLAYGLPLDRGLSSEHLREQDRKSTRLNSSHVAISYAVFCLKKKKITDPYGIQNI